MHEDFSSDEIKSKPNKKRKPKTLETPKKRVKEDKFEKKEQTKRSASKSPTKKGPVFIKTGRSRMGRSAGRRKTHFMRNRKDRKDLDSGFFLQNKLFKNNERETVSEKLEQRLGIEKFNIDLELEHLEKKIKKKIEKLEEYEIYKDYIKILLDIIEIIKRFLNLDVQFIKNAGVLELVNELEKLGKSESKIVAEINAKIEENIEINIPTINQILVSGHVIFCISRISRIIKVLNCNDKKSKFPVLKDSPRKINSVESPSSLEQTKPEKKKDEKIVDRTSKEKAKASLKKTMSIIKILSPIFKKRKSNEKPKEKVLCRICETKIDAKKFKDHEKLCKLRKQLSITGNKLNEKLNFAKKQIDEILEINKNGSKVQTMRQLTDIELSVLPEIAEISKELGRIEYGQKSSSKNTIETLKRLKKLNKSTPKIKVKKDGVERICSTVPNFFKKVEYYGKRKESVSKKIDKVIDKNKRYSLDVNEENFKKRITIADFDILNLISKGGYGSVYLGRKKTTQDMFAIKVLEKSSLEMKNNNINNMLMERNIMISGANNGANPWVVKVYYSFQGKKYWYIVMEFCPGGDLFSHLCEFTFFDLDQTKQFVAELVLALGYIHERKIIHRDIKPDNILIDVKGHIKLTDFGLSETGLMDREMFLSKMDLLGSHSITNSMSFLFGSPSVTDSFYNLPTNFGELLGSPTAMDMKGNVRNSFYAGNISEEEKEEKSGNNSEEQNSNSKKNIRGTPDYLAPELLLGKEHGNGVDWWALGVITFQFLFGVPPFNDESPDKIFANILNRRIAWPENLVDFQIPDEAIDFIKRLLHNDPEKRLGKNGVEEVKNHPYLRDVDWKNVQNEEPYFVPNFDINNPTKGFRYRNEVLGFSESEKESFFDESLIDDHLEDNNITFVNISELINKSKE